MALVNKGAADARLVAVATAVTGEAELHATTTENVSYGCGRERPSR